LPKVTIAKESKLKTCCAGSLDWSKLTQPKINFGDFWQFGFLAMREIEG